MVPALKRSRKNKERIYPIPQSEIIELDVLSISEFARIPRTS
jgi:hypothetical protein